MPSRNALVQYDAPLPDQVTPEARVLTGVQVVFPLLVMLYNEDPEARKEMSSYCKDNSQNGAVWADKARLVAKVRVKNAKNGASPMITDNDDATVSRWCSFGARYLDGIARTKRKLAAESQARLASQVQPDDQSDD